MRGLLRDNYIEAIVGLLVVAIAAWFILFAWQRTGGGEARDAIEVKALFPAINGVDIGTDVRIAGMKVGTVTGQRLDPQSYQAEVTLALDPSVPVPADSSAAVTAEGLLGGTYVTLIPGGAPNRLKQGDVILDTQGSVDMMGLVGSLINRSGSGSAPAEAPVGGGQGLGSMEEPADQ